MDKYALVTLEGTQEEKLVCPFDGDSAIAEFESKLGDAIDHLRTWEVTQPGEVIRELASA